MNHIQGITCVGAPRSVARLRAAIENAALCSECYGICEFNSHAPFKAEKIKREKFEDCYLCESLTNIMYKLTKIQSKEK